MKGLRQSHSRQMALVSALDQTTALCVDGMPFPALKWPHCSKGNTTWLTPFHFLRMALASSLDQVTRCVYGMLCPAVRSYWCQSIQAGLIQSHSLQMVLVSSLDQVTALC